MRARPSTLLLSASFGLGLVSCASDLGNETFVVQEKTLSLTVSAKFQGYDAKESSEVSVEFDGDTVSASLLLEPEGKSQNKQADAGTEANQVPNLCFATYLASPSKQVLLDATTAESPEAFFGHHRPLFNHLLNHGGSIVSWPVADDIVYERGTYRLRVACTTEKAILRTVIRRKEATKTGTLDLNLFYVRGSGVSSNEDAPVKAAIDEAFEALGAVGIQRGTVQITDVPESFLASLNLDDSEAFATIGEYATGVANKRAANVFFVRSIESRDSSGVILGLASGIPVPFGVGTPQHPGVLVAVSGHAKEDTTVDVEALGNTIAHELGHSMGLFHTTEGNIDHGGQYDLLPDTAQCPLWADADLNNLLDAHECADFDASNAMFWTSFGKPVFTAGQGFVMRHSLVVKGEPK